MQLETILGHRKDSRAISKKDKYIFTKGKSRRLRKSTVGWCLKVKWSIGKINWVPLRIMKENYPVQVAEYTVASDIDKEPAFA